MGSADSPEGLVKTQVLIIGVLIALVVGFVGGVVFSSFTAPLPPAVVANGKAPQPSGGQPPQNGPHAEILAKIPGLEAEVKANPSNTAAWTTLGNLYFDTEQSAKAIVAYKKSLELKQDQPNVWTDLGIMYRHERQFNEALAAFDKATDLQPNFEQAWFNKGIVLIVDLGKKEQGAQAWQKVVAINPNAHAPNGQMVKDMLASVTK